MLFLFSGIEIGEIGTKLGMHAVNNGFLKLENVRIPREHMLMKNSKVLEVCNT
jgi:acyl-CoA oxidase